MDKYNFSIKDVQVGTESQAGTIIVNSWGYDQTNIDFYEVVRKSAKSVWLRRLKSTTTETGFMSGDTIPVTEGYLRFSDQHPDVIRKLIRNGGGVNFEYGAAYLSDGGSEQCSWYA